MKYTFTPCFSKRTSTCTRLRAFVRVCVRVLVRSDRNKKPTKAMVTVVPDHMDFPAEEQRIIELWKKIDAFHTCLKQSKDRPKYTFYDGPPFATGLPHYGHILAGTIKVCAKYGAYTVYADITPHTHTHTHTQDVVTRYAHQSGYHVSRRFGWDCHGLPVEYEIDKTLGIKVCTQLKNYKKKKFASIFLLRVMRMLRRWVWPIIMLSVVRL